MSAFFRLSALALLLALSACAGRHADDTRSQTHTRSGVEVYGDIDAGVGSQRIR